MLPTALWASLRVESGSQPLPGGALRHVERAHGPLPGARPGAVLRLLGGDAAAVAGDAGGWGGRSGGRRCSSTCSTPWRDRSRCCSRGRDPPLSGAESYLFADLLAATERLDVLTQTWLFAGFALAFAVKLPLFPIHHWLIDFHEQNHPSGAADVAGTLYKVGGFGLFAWALPLLPEGARQLAPLLLALGAFTAPTRRSSPRAQHHLKRLLAYASLSHMGLVAVGLFGLHLAGLSGAMYLLAAQMITTGGLFLISGMLHARRGSFDADSYGGLAASAPALAATTLLVLFASIGVPGLANFPGEFLALLGAFQASSAAGVSPCWR
jgi:NADH:ubiquinone oxidoreductase subunit 4 (subunit M)